MKWFFFFFILADILHSQIIIIKDYENEVVLSGIKISDGILIHFSDSLGRFDLQSFDKNNKLSFSSALYDSVTYSYSELTKKKIIYLKKKLIESSEVIVEAKKNVYEAENQSTIKIDDYSKEKYNLLSDFLNKNTLIFVKDYGGGEAIKTLSYRGMSSENTQVLFNEVTFNSISSGFIFLESMNFSGFDSVVIHKSVNYFDAISASGGIIELHSKPDYYDSHMKVLLKLGTADYKNISVKYNDFISKFNFKLNLDYSQSENKYKFVFDNKIYERSNSDFRKYFLSVDLFYDSKINFSSNFRIFHLNSGIPGFVVSNNFNSSSARSNSFNFLNTTGIEIPFSEKVIFKSKVLFNFYSYLIDDPVGELLTLPDKHKSDILDLTEINRAEINCQNVSLNLGIDFRYSNLKKTSEINTYSIYNYKINRFQTELYLSGKINWEEFAGFFDNINLFSFIRAKNLNENFLFKLDYGTGISFEIFKIRNLKINFNYSENYRLPTFNEIFYSRLISYKDLLPEKYKNITAGFSYFGNLFGNYKINFDMFYIKGVNKIIWIPSRLAFQSPQNISEIDSKGFEFEFSHYLNYLDIEYLIIYTFNNARNRTKLSENDNQQNKRLIYTPNHKIIAGINKNLLDFNFSVNASYTSDVYYTYDNTNTNKLEDFLLLDFSVGFNFNFLGQKNRINLQCNNALNKSYYIIQSYPMPLRAFYLTYFMEIK